MVSTRSHRDDKELGFLERHSNVYVYVPNLIGRPGAIAPASPAGACPPTGPLAAPQATLGSCLRYTPLR
jgi:hypothetical protein